MDRLVITLTLLTAVFYSPILAADVERLDPIVEVRAVWIDAAAMPKSEFAIREMVENYARAGINVLFPESICRGYAVYPSELLVRDPRFAGAPDTLAILIREAHRLGIEVHPWVWVFRAGYSLDRGGILKAHPDWAERDSEGNELSKNGGYWLSPANPAVRDFLVEIFRELVTKYDVDGLHLDYIRYESQAVGDFGYSDVSVAEFIRQYGFDPRPAAVEQPADNRTNITFDVDRFLEPPIGPLQEDKLKLLDKWRRFREDQISGFVERVCYEMRHLNPGPPNPLRRPLMISAAVGEMPNTARLLLFQNWQNWIDNKWLDFVVPMSYTIDDARFLRLVRLQREAVGWRSILVPGIGVHLHKNPEQTACQVLFARKARADGVSLFSTSYLKPNYLAAVENLSCDSRREPDTNKKLDEPVSRCLLPFREPLSGVSLLWNRAAELYAAGQIEEGDHFLARGDALAGYATYHAFPTPYFRPVH